MAFYAIGLLVRFVSTYNIHEKSVKVNGYAPFSPYCHETRLRLYL